MYNSYCMRGRVLQASLFLSYHRKHKYRTHRLCCMSEKVHIHILYFQKPFKCVLLSKIEVKLCSPMAVR